MSEDSYYRDTYHDYYYYLNDFFGKSLSTTNGTEYLSAQTTHVIMTLCIWGRCKIRVTWSPKTVPNYAWKSRIKDVHSLEHPLKTLSTVIEGRIQRARNDIPTSANEGPVVSITRSRTAPHTNKAIATLRRAGAPLCWTDYLARPRNCASNSTAGFLIHPLSFRATPVPRTDQNLSIFDCTRLFPR